MKTSGYQKCESARKPIMDELSRVLASDGTVVKSMENGETVVSV